jgi:hypothetical protein
MIINAAKNMNPGSNSQYTDFFIAVLLTYKMVLFTRFTGAHFKNKRSTLVAPAVPVTNRSYDRCYPWIFLISFYSEGKIQG